MKANCQNTQVLLVDMQTRLMPAMHHRQAVMERSRFLLRCMEILEIPVTVSEQYRKGLGPTEEEILQVIPEIVPMEKITFSCLGQEEMREKLLTGPENVLVLGVEAHICVMQTALDLIEAGKRVILVCDCIDSRNPYDRKIAIKRLAQAGCILTTSESIVYELMERAGSTEFKQISALVKEAPLFPGEK